MVAADALPPGFATAGVVVDPGAEAGFEVAEACARPVAHIRCSAPLEAEPGAAAGDFALAAPVLGGAFVAAASGFGIANSGAADLTAAPEPGSAAVDGAAVVIAGVLTWALNCEVKATAPERAATFKPTADAVGTEFCPTAASDVTAGDELGATGVEEIGAAVEAAADDRCSVEPVCNGKASAALLPALTLGILRNVDDLTAFSSFGGGTVGLEISCAVPTAVEVNDTGVLEA